MTPDLLNSSESSWRLGQRATGDLPSHEVHKKSVRYLVSSRGGLDALGHDGLAQCTLMQWESFWALNTGWTIFPEVRPAYAPVYPVHPFSEDLRLLISKLPTGLRALAKERKLAMDVLGVLARTANAKQEQKKKGSVVTQTDIFRSRERRYHDFWEACSCLAAPDVDGPSLEKLLVLALLLYCLHTFSPMRAVTTVYNGSRMKLTNDIRQRKRGTVKEEECLLWIWIVLVDSWRSASGTLLPTGIELMQQAGGEVDTCEGLGDGESDFKPFLLGRSICEEVWLLLAHGVADPVVDFQCINETRTPRWSNVAGF